MFRGSILCIVHQRTSYPARLGTLFMEQGFVLDVRCPNIGQALPETTENYAATLMFGGPQSAFEDHIPCIPKEINWIDKAIQGAAPFVGVCLGAQILARALGAKVWRHPMEHVEIGYTEIHPTQAGQVHLNGPMKVFQWHKDGFDLPAGAILLASGGAEFPNQFFRYEEHCYALQFHPEVTMDMVKRWTIQGAHMLDRPGAMAREEQIRLYPTLDPIIERWTRQFVSYIIELAERRGAAVAPLNEA